MSTVQSILDDVKLRYRHTFTNDQVLVWFNEEQRELFDILELDSPPYTFQTVLDEHFYPFPDGFDVTKIKVVTYQNDATVTPEYVEIPFKRNDRLQDEPYYQTWWTITSDAMYLSVDGGVPDARNVYVYCDSDPTEVTTSNLSVSPDLPQRYQEILKLGILQRIAMARKDVTFQNNYSNAREEKIMEVLLLKKLKEPEWFGPTDVMPKISSNLPWPNGWPFWTPNGAG